MSSVFSSFNPTRKDFSAFWKELGELLPLPQTSPEPPTPTLEPDALEEPLLYSLQKMISPDRILTATAELKAYAGRGSHLGLLQSKSSFPQAIVLPDNESEVAALMLWSAQREINLLPWGGGTDPYAAKTHPQAPFLIVNMERMNRILKVDPLRATLQIQAGVPWKEIEPALSSYQLTPGQVFAATEATVGGIVATNSAGIKDLGYGALASNILQIRAITPSGPIEIGPPTPGKPDARTIMLGSYGAWGIITEVTMRLFPTPQEKTRLIISFTTWKDAVTILQRVLQEEYKLTSARIVGETEKNLFTTAGAPILRQLIPVVRNIPSIWKAHLFIEIEGQRETVTLNRQRLEKLLQEAEVHLEINRKPPPYEYGLWPQRQLWAEELWERGLLAHTVTVTVPWSDVSEFVEDWDEALSSVIYATSGSPGLPLTKAYATRDYAVIETLLIGQRATGSLEALENQLRSIKAVVVETKRRWNVATNTSTLMTLAMVAAGEKLDPQGVMIR